MPRRSADIESDSRLLLRTRAGWIVAVTLQVGIAEIADAAGCGSGGANVGQQFRDDRIRSCGLSVTRRQIEQIYRLGAIRVLENADLRLRIQDRSRPVHLARLAELFIIDEEECLVAADEETGNDDWASQAKAVLIEQHPGSRRFAGRRIRRKIAIAEPVVGIEHRVAMVLVDAAVEIVRSLACDEFDLGR